MLIYGMMVFQAELLISLKINGYVTKYTHNSLACILPSVSHKEGSFYT